MILVKRWFQISESLRKASLLLIFLLLQICAQSQSDSAQADSTQAARNEEKNKKPSAAIANIDTTLLFQSTPDEQRFSIQNSTKPIDSTLDNLHNYYQMGVLGNIGLPSYSLIANGSTNLNDGFFRWMNLNNQNDLFTSKQPVFFYPKGKIYTKIFAAMGQKQEQVFKILHSQNIGRVNVSLQFNRYSCIGFYTNQKTITDNLLFSSHAQTKNGRTGYNFYFLFNKLKYQLNGGIDTTRVDFEKNILVEKQLFPLLLSTAKQNVRTAEVNFSTFFKLSNDTVGGLHFLEYETNYKGSYWLYSDGISDSAFFTNNYFTSTTGTNKDSVSFKQWSNSVTYSFKLRAPGGRDKAVFYAGYKNEFNHYNAFTVDTLTLNHILRAGGKFSSQKTIFLAQGQYAVGGFNAGNYLWSVKYRSDFDQLFYMLATADGGSQKPAFMNFYYFAPHFIWNNPPQNVITNNLKLEFGSQEYKFSFGVFAQNQVNQVYFDQSALPQQYSGSTVLTRLYAQKDLKLGPIHFNNVLNYQNTKNTDIIRLPQYYTFHQLYYEGKLFKKALWLQLGVQARYISAFLANAYMPATNQFYLQDNKQYGNYVFVDIFLNAQIERFRFFLLASHINQGLSGGNYMLCPNYAMPDRSLKAGLCWMFFD